MNPALNKTISPILVNVLGDRAHYLRQDPRDQH